MLVRLLCNRARQGTKLYPRIIPSYTIVFAKPTFLNSLCTASCNRTLTSFGDSLSRVCGDSDIFSSSIAETSLGFIGASNYTSPETNTTIPSSLNATTVTSYLQFVRSISCIKTTPSSSSYCVNEQFTEVRKAGATWNILNITATIVSNTSVACSDCIKTQLDVAYNSTKFVDYAALKPGLIEAYKYWNETCGEETPVIKRRHQISRRRRGLLF